MGPRSDANFRSYFQLQGAASFILYFISLHLLYLSLQWVIQVQDADELQDISCWFKKYFYSFTTMLQTHFTSTTITIKYEGKNNAEW